ncbi:nuclear transport factor 2 family protein [Trujillonella endophytica]|uniref:SnoaL-like domain-containing protein n=1 Tax=Trujillonella endophytica TaxID=673521 RepID=A0A1H8P8S7_9ACTN|nr:nuclear transport factor 2 family protein [Trujillella endophytica]SEO38359.1 hypothetical protein SAMN05660991_00034 [Trujillella endophytica]
MSEHPNAARIREGYEAFGKGDLAVLAELWQPDIVWHEPGNTALSGTYRGTEAVFALFGRIMELTEGSLRGEPLLICADDDYGTALVRLTAHRGDRSLSTLVAHVFRVVDGRTAEFWEGPTDQPALDAFFG